MRFDLPPDVEHDGNGTYSYKGATARILADSIPAFALDDFHSGESDLFRLVTFEAACWRPNLAEQNTHRALSRNSASSRAIPVTKMLDRFDTERFTNPIAWPSEIKGMAGGPPLAGDDLRDAVHLYDDVLTYIGTQVRSYVKAHPVDKEGAVRLHKSLLNRLLEIGLLQPQIISGTALRGYFWQRVHNKAEPHIQAMAIAMCAAYQAHEPKILEKGEYHRPLWGADAGHKSDWADAFDLAADRVGRIPTAPTAPEVEEIATRCSIARCGRVSYLTQHGVRDLTEDLRLYSDLADRESPLYEGDPPHASPLEHVATPWEENQAMVPLPNGKTMGPLPRVGNFLGWFQARHDRLGF